MTVVPEGRAARARQHDLGVCRVPVLALTFPSADLVRYVERGTAQAAGRNIGVLYLDSRARGRLC